MPFALLASGHTGDEHVFEELAGPAPGATVDVATISLLEPKPGGLEDGRIQVAPVVDHDHDRSAAGQRLSAARQHRRDPVGVGGDRGARDALLRCAELELPPVVEPEQLVGAAMLLVVVDQPRIWRRGDDAVAAWQLDLPRVAVQDLCAPTTRAHARELLDSRHRVEPVAAEELRRRLDRAADALVLVAPVLAELRRAWEVQVEVRRPPRRP